MAATSVNGTSDPYGCTICDPFNPAYDGPPPIYMDDLGFGYDDDYYYDDPENVKIVIDTILNTIRD